MISCLSNEQLTSLLEGQLADAERQALESHLQTCPSCEQRLATLADDPNTSQWRDLLALVHADKAEKQEEAFLQRLQLQTLPGAQEREE